MRGSKFMVASFLVIALPLALLTFLYAKQDVLIFPGAWMPKARLSQPLGQHTERLWRHEPDASVEAWYRPPFDNPTSRPRAIVVFLHGNNEIIDPWESILQPYVQWGYGLLLPEYRGYGRSTGSPGLDNVLADTEAFLQTLRARYGQTPPPLIFHGRSLGGGLATALAKRHKPAALILQQSFSRLSQVAWEKYAIPSFLFRRDLDTAQSLPALALPTLLIHGHQDQLIPFSHAKDLQAALPQAQIITGPWAHQDVPNDTAYWQAIDNFLTHHLSGFDQKNAKPSMQ